MLEHVFNMFVHPFVHALFACETVVESEERMSAGCFVGGLRSLGAESGAV